MDSDKIGGFICKLRKEKGITQAQLGELLGISGKSISKWECGKTMPDINLLLDLSDVLGVSTTEILKGDKLDNQSTLTNIILRESHNNESKHKLLLYQKKC
jgi:transcriptional regulator with XRE-family HTH domain